METMIIESVRLKNIKSYDEGEDGKGVRIDFAPGTNRIAGLNGHGKTTLIEVIGYALFCSEPIFEENFDIATYFLRAGKKAGEIDLQFQHEHESYRIERGLGPQSQRRAKVIQLSDGSICAEGNAEVARFLCRLFRVDKDQHLAELFSKLIGVRQGRLTWPFDSTPSEAKRFFEPLLEVAVFRECYDRLKPVIDDLKVEVHTQEKTLAGVEERLREREGTDKLVEQKRSRRIELERQVKDFIAVRDAAYSQKEALEARENLIKETDQNRETAQGVLTLATQQFKAAAQRIEEARVAAEVIASAAPAYQAYEEAEKRLQVLRLQQRSQAILEKQKNDMEKEHTALEGRLNSACEQADLLARQIHSKKEVRTAMQEKANQLQRNLAESLTDFEVQDKIVDQMVQDLSKISHFVKGTENSLSDRKENLHEILALEAEIRSWDSAAPEQARQRETKADDLLQEARQRLAEADSARTTLTTQLVEIGDGFCPFLKEQCRQFDPAKVEADLSRKQELVNTLNRDVVIAKAKLDQTKAHREQIDLEATEIAGRRAKLEGLVHWLIRSLCDPLPVSVEVTVTRLLDRLPDLEMLPPLPPAPPSDADGLKLEVFHERSLLFHAELARWTEAVESRVQDRVRGFREEQRRQNAEDQNLINLKTQLVDIDNEIEKLTIAEKTQLKAAKTFEDQIRQLAGQLTDLEQRLKEYVPVADEIAHLEWAQQNQREDYQRYLGAKPLADQKKDREEELKNRQNEMTAAAVVLKSREAIYKEAHKEFDPSELSVARREFEQRSLEVARESVHLSSAIEDLKREEKRLHEWEQTWANREVIVNEIDRLNASICLTELARTVLRACAPAVAQHLCDRIAQQAQQIFNQINHDPVELNWEAIPRYSLRVIPGNRRFAMLSGGEQTKLALAMTLAMIQQFSGLRFCIFDEPTYGVDAESREKLADAILTAQEAAGFEQLIIVSHDDAFNGKIEHSIFLQKRADLGTFAV